MDTAAAWIHAYLHRQEGDASNARYWYGQAQRPFPASQSLAEEWRGSAQSLLQN